MKPLRTAAICLNVVIVLGLIVLQIVMAVSVSAVIADFEARTGGTADNDFGQRGVFLGAMVLFGAVALATLSIWKLHRSRAAGFVWHAMLWFVLWAVSGAVPLPDSLDPYRWILELACLAGACSGIALSLVDAGQSRRTRRGK